MRRRQLNVQKRFLVAQRRFGGVADDQPDCLAAAIIDELEF